MEHLMTEIYNEIEKILEERVRPLLSRHSGGVRLVEIKNEIAYVKLTGHCSGCPSAKYTMESIVKEEILKASSEVKDVILQEEVSQELYDFAKAILNKTCT